MKLNFCLAFLSCFYLFVFSTKVEAIIPMKKSSNELHISPEVDSLVAYIQSEQYNNILNIVDPANSLLLNSDVRARYLGEIYLTKVDLYTDNNPKYLKRLLELTDDIKPYPELESILFNCYYVLLRFNDRLENYEGVAKILNLALDNLFRKENKEMRTVLLLTVDLDILEEEKAIEDIRSVLEDIKSDPWSYIHADLNIKLADLLFKIGREQDAIALYRKMVKENLANGLKSHASRSYWAWGFREENKAESVSLIEKAIQYRRESGYNYLLPSIYSTLGHVYFNTKNWDKAFESYNKALTLEEEMNSYTDSLSGFKHLYNAYLGYTYFQKEGHSETAYNDACKLYFDPLLEDARKRKDYRTLKMTLQRKKYCCNIMGKTAMAQQFNPEIERVEEEYNRIHNHLKTKNFKLRSLIGLKQKDHEINTLNLTNNLQESQLKIQTILLATGLLILISLVYLALNYRQNDSLTTEIIIKNRQVEEQKNELKAKNLKIQMDLKENLLQITNTDIKVKAIVNQIESINGIDEGQKYRLVKQCKDLHQKKLMKRIDLQFADINAEFFNKLSSLHTDLSSNNLRLCTLLKMNLSTKEISTILGSNQNSVRVAVSRLRRKLDINKDYTLSAYFNSL